MTESTRYSKSQEERASADVLLVTVTEVEAQAVLTLFSPYEVRFINKNTYYDLGVVGGAHTLMVQSDMGAGGPSGAMLTIKDAIQVLTPAAIIMIGIAFGLKPTEQAIGDILVSRQVLDYEAQRVSTDPDRILKIQPRGDRPSASVLLLDRFKNGMKNWSAPPRVHSGLILSGAKLIDNIQFRDQLHDLEPEAIGGEMEGAGLYATASREKVDWIVVKAICDWADGTKLKNQVQRQQLAAENAAKFVFHVLQQGGLAAQHLRTQETSRPSTKILARGTTLYTYNQHLSWVVAVDWEPHGSRIASAGGDGTVRIWNADTQQHLITYSHHTQWRAKIGWPPTIYNVAWSPNGEHIASSGEDAKVYVWDAETGKTTMIYQGHSGLLPNLFAFAWSPDSTRIASACSSIGIDKTIHVWDIKTGKKLFPYDAHLRVSATPYSVLDLAWSPDGTRIASDTPDKTIRVWNATNGKQLLAYQTNAQLISAIAWSPDNQKIAFSHPNHTVHIWDATTGKDTLVYSGHSNGIRDIAWAPDGTCIASASNDRTVQIWNPLNGKHIFTYEKHTDWVGGFTWSPDGTRIASASNDRTVQIWQAR